MEEQLVPEEVRQYQLAYDKLSIDKVFDIIQNEQAGNTYINILNGISWDSGV